VQEALDAVHQALAEHLWTSDYKSLHYPIRPYNQLISLNSAIQSGQSAPTEAQRRVTAELGAAIAIQLARLREIENTDIARLNRVLEELGVPPIFVPRLVS